MFRRIGLTKGREGDKGEGENRREEAAGRPILTGVHILGGLTAPLREGECIYWRGAYSGRGDGEKGIPILEGVHILAGVISPLGW